MSYNVTLLLVRPCNAKLGQVISGKDRFVQVLSG
jgi:hypothetical protein